MSLDKLPVQIEVDKACDRFIDECRKNGNKVVTTELTRLVKHTSFLIMEDAMSTAIERFEASMKARDAIHEKNLNQIKWLTGLLVALIIALIGVVLSERKQPTQYQQPPVQQQQVLPPVQQPVQPQQTVEPAKQDGQTVLP